MTLITGNTYPVKDAIKELGGTWSKAKQGWLVPDDKADQARALVGMAATHYKESSPRSSRPSRYRSNYARFAGGGEAYVNKRGCCEDAPCCGCCS
jgi:hypothetical protein